MRSPLIFSPAEFFPENVKTGIVSSLYVLTVNLVVLPSNSVLSSRGSSGGCAGSRTAGQAGAAIDHFLQLVLIARPR
jgi:hypothetical protein